MHVVLLKFHIYAMKIVLVNLFINLFQILYIIKR